MKRIFMIKHKFIPALLIIVFLMSASAFSQSKGSITGKVIDKTSSEELIGANILVAGTNFGASTDIDGNYVINNLEPGMYSIKISYISYKTLIVEKVTVNPNQATTLTISLEPSSTELDEVVITAEALKNTESNILKIQKNSSNIVDGVSAELIKKNNSSDGTDILKRMTGVTMSEGKYAFIRGVGDRYNNTLLNGANLPSTDPEKKSFSYDIFPASLVENIITSKTFTPDKPADFSGGLVQINTIEFPSKFTLEISNSSTYNSAITSKSFSSYNGGSKDYLGYDDGTRSYPSIITSTRVARGNYSDKEIVDITSGFKNNWNLTSFKAPVNNSFKLTVGDKYQFGEEVIGYVAAFNYSNNFDYTQKQSSFYDFTGPRYNYTGENYSRNVGIGGMLNLSMKFGGTNKISLKNIFNQNADDEVTVYKGDYRYSGQYREISSLKYVSRSVRSHQLLGEHFFNLLNGLNADWGLSYSRSDRNEPDGRRYVYARDLEETSENLRFILDQALTTRFYGDLTDNDNSFSTKFTLKPFENPNLPKVSFGIHANKKDRNFDARIFGFKNGARGNFVMEDSVLQLPVDQIFMPENINETFINVVEVTKPADSYSSDQKVYAGYLMFDAMLFDQLRLVSGFRFEYSNQNLISQTITGEPVDVKSFYRDYLPSVNLTYALSQNLNIRFGYSKTLARPEFRETAPFTYFDFLANELVQGNTELKRTLIDNYDLRFELFPGAGELLAASIFYKQFNNPIEQILLASSGNEPIRSFANALNANNYGVEFEIRKNLSFIYDEFQNFSFVGNITLINSKIKIDRSGNQSFQKSERPLQGQADYVFNLGLYFDDAILGLNTSIVYNKVGNKIAKVGVNDLGDIIEKPVDLIDFSVSKKLFSNFTIKLTAKDLLNQDKRFIQQTNSGDRVSELNKSGRNFSIGLSYQL